MSLVPTNGCISGYLERTENNVRYCAFELCIMLCLLIRLRHTDSSMLILTLSHFTSRIVLALYLIVQSFRYYYILPFPRSNLQRFRHSLHVPLRLDIYYQYDDIEPAPSNDNADGNNPDAPQQQQQQQQSQTVQKRDLLERWCIDYIPSSDPLASSSILGSSSGVGGYGNISAVGAQQHRQQQQQQQLGGTAHDDILVQLRRVCRRVVVLLRNLHCLTRMMPGYGLHQSLIKGAATKRGLGNLGGVGGYYGNVSSAQMAALRHHLSVPDDVKHHPAAGKIGYALYPSSTDGLRSEAALFGSSSSPFARHEVGSVPTPFGMLHLTAFYDKTLDVGSIMKQRLGRLRTLGLLGMSEEEEEERRRRQEQQQYEQQQQLQRYEQGGYHQQQRGAIAIPQQQNRCRASTENEHGAKDENDLRHQSLPSHAMQTEAAAAAGQVGTSMPYGASPIIQDYARSPLQRPRTLGRSPLPSNLMLNRANSLPPSNKKNQAVQIGSGSQTPVSVGSGGPQNGGEQGGENKRVMSGLSLALMNEEAKENGDSPAEQGTIGQADEPAAEDDEQDAVRRRALHHPPPTVYGYGYNNPEFSSGQPVRVSPTDREEEDDNVPAILRSLSSSPSPMVLVGGTPTDAVASTPPFSQGLAMAAAARAGRSGAPDSPGTPGSAASLRRAGLLRTQQRQGGGSGRAVRISPADAEFSANSPPFMNPLSLRGPPTPESGRILPPSNTSSPGQVKVSELVAAVPPPSLHVPDPAEKSSGRVLLPPLSSLDMLRTSPFKASGSSMVAGGLGSAVAYSSQQQGSMHNQQISGSGNVGFSLLSSLSGTAAASPYSTAYGSGTFFQAQSTGGLGDDGAGFSSKMGSAYGIGSRTGAGSTLAPHRPTDGDDDEMPFAVEAVCPAPSFGSSGLGSNITDAQRASGLMAGSGSSQLLVASFAHRCATAGRLKMFEEESGDLSGSNAEQKEPGEEGGSAGAAPNTNKVDDLTDQLAHLRAFGASLMAEGSQAQAPGTVGSD